MYRVLKKAKYICEESGSGGVELIPAENVVMTCILFLFKNGGIYGETIESLIIYKTHRYIVNTSLGQCKLSRDS